MSRRMPIRSISTVSCAESGGGIIICSPCFTRSRKGRGSWLLLSLAVLVLVRRSRHRVGRRDRARDRPAGDPPLDEPADGHQPGPALCAADPPYVFIAAGKVVPWSMGLAGRWRRVMGALIAGSLGLTIAASVCDPPGLPLLFQLGLGRPGSGAGAADRQQPRLGPGPGRAPEMVEGDDPGSADRPGVLRPDQPVALRGARRAVPMVPPAGPSRAPFARWPRTRARCSKAPSPG